MNDEQAQAHSDTLGEPASGPTLTRVRRRGESHVLALVSAGVVILIAIAVAKPWGQGVPPAASAPTGSTSAELARSSAGSAPPLASAATPSAQPAMGLETDQPFLIIFQPVEDPSGLLGVCTIYQVTRTVTGTQIEVAVDPSGVPYFSGELATSLDDGTMVLTCPDALQPLEPVSPDPTAP